MPEFRVNITRVTDEAFPTFVECKFFDAQGQEHTIVEKAPVVSVDALSIRSAFPLTGCVSCQIVSEREDETGRMVLLVDTAHPHGIESISGQTQFELLAQQVSA